MNSKMRKALACLIIAMFALFSVACGGTAQGFDLEEYKAAVSECRDAINEAGIVVANVGSYEINYYNLLSSVSSDTPDFEALVESAFEWLTENTDASRETVDETYNSIRQQYKDIILTEIEGREAEEIDSAFRELYDAYESMYSLVTNPSGSASDFATNIEDYMNAMVSSDESISLFLDE